MRFRSWTRPSELCSVSSKHSSSFLELKSRGNVSSLNKPQFFSTTIYFCDSSSPRSRSNLRRWNKMCAAGCCWLIGRYFKPIWRKILANNAEANFLRVQRDTEKCLWKQSKVDRFCWRRKPTCCRAAAADSFCSFNSVLRFSSFILLKLVSLTGCKPRLPEFICVSLVLQVTFFTRAQ